MRRSIEGSMRGMGAVVFALALVGVAAPAGAQEDRLDAPRPSPGPTQPPAMQPPPTWLPPASPAQPGQPVAPPWAQPQPWMQPYGPPRPVAYEERPMYGLSIAGFSIFGGLWITNALLGGYVGGQGWFAVPVIGPWGYISKYRQKFDCTPSQFDFCPTEGEGDRFAYFALVLDGLIQAAGVAMGITGLVAKHKVPVYAQPRFTVVPRISPTGAGLVAAGSF